jgi:hypothetical protein
MLFPTCSLEGGHQRITNAVTAPVRPKLAGTRGLCLRQRLVDTEGCRRRNRTYAEGILTPMGILVGWPGDPLCRRHRHLTVGPETGGERLAPFL